MHSWTKTTPTSFRILGACQVQIGYPGTKCMCAVEIKGRVAPKRLPTGKTEQLRSEREGTRDVTFHAPPLSNE